MKNLIEAIHQSSFLPCCSCFCLSHVHHPILLYGRKQNSYLPQNNYENDENKKDITMETKDVKYWSETYKNQSRINKKRMNEKRTRKKEVMRKKNQFIKKLLRRKQSSFMNNFLIFTNLQY